jgi:FtsP/CotA-like multicopper oxidase with cupredoxin domain
MVAISLPMTALNFSAKQFLFAGVLLLASMAAAQSPAPIAVANDNTRAAGRLANGVLTVSLELHSARWQPDARMAPIPVYGFAETGQAVQDPGPLIRVPEGTEIRATLRNLLPVAARVHGLHTRPGKNEDLVALAPGEAREVRFAAGAPGTYFYWAETRTTEFPPPSRVEEDTELAGAFVVDPRGTAPADRIFVINLWFTKLLQPEFREQLGINGRSWPTSERLTLTAGKPVRWRIINPTISDHAMHLHGFFYDVTGMGDAEHFEPYAPGQERRVVTQHINPGETFDMEWLPERAGNWLFHCHMTGHMTHETAPELYGFKPAAVPTMHSAHDSGSGMYGLVLGITVKPSDGSSSAATGPRDNLVRVSNSEARPTPALHKVHLFVRERPATRYVPAGPAFVLEDGKTPAANIGPALVLTRGEPTEITVTNTTNQATAVHWHGMELESYYDGVPEWAGVGPQLAPVIAPRSSFVARMTPPRAGTYIYHTHWHDVGQLTSGLYGAMLVLEPGEKYEPATDKVMLIGRAGPNGYVDPLLLNGSPQPNSMELIAGTRYRLRFVNMTPNDSFLIVTLTADGKPARWRAVGKDGAALPASQAVEQDAALNITVGETYDFEFTPQSGIVNYELAVRTPDFPPVQKLVQVLSVATPRP